MIIEALNLMWKGMLSIFIAIGIVYLAVLALHKATNRTKKPNDEAKEE